jgi:tetratricopeptide (TPR) repeat protein
MIFSLRGPLRKSAFAVLSLLLVVLYLEVAARYHQASRLSQSAELEPLQRASRLAPVNALYHDRIGRYFFLVQQDVGAGLEHYRMAAALDPYEARYWLDLAAAYQVSGNRQEERKALERALQTDPRTPDIAWEVGNFYLAEGDRTAALRQLRVVLEHNPWDVDRTLDLCWRATRDADLILDQAVPPRAGLYFDFLRILSGRQEPAAAARVWSRLIGLKDPFPAKDAFPYLQYLLDQKQVASAQAAWQQLVSRNSLQAYLAPGSSVVNGGFEQTVLEGGFDWRHLDVLGVRVAIEEGEAHSGSRSLRITFDDTSAADAGVVQFVPVEPGADYELSAYLKADNLVAASGPRLAVYDAYSPALYAMSEEVQGSTPWQIQSIHFKAKPDARLVALRIIRSPASGTVRGTLWLDDVRMARGAKP